MFKLIERSEFDRSFSSGDYIRYSPAETSTIKIANSEIIDNIPGIKSFVSLLNSYFDLYFDVLHAATGNRYADSRDIRLVNLSALDLFSKYKRKTSSAKHLEEFSHAHFVSLI